MPTPAEFAYGNPAMRPGSTSKPRTNLWITRRRRPTSRHGGRIRRSCSYQGPRQGRSRALRRCCSYEGPGQPENRRNGGSVTGERCRCPHNRSNGGTAHPVPGVCYGFPEDAYADGNTIALDGRAARRTSPPRPAAAGRTAAAWRLRLLRHQLRSEWGVGPLEPHRPSLGDGRVVHARDVVRVDSSEQAERLDVPPTGTQPRSLDWTPVERILVNARPLPAER